MFVGEIILLLRLESIGSYDQFTTTCRICSTLLEKHAWKGYMWCPLNSISAMLSQVFFSCLQTFWWETPAIVL